MIYDQKNHLKRSFIRPIADPIKLFFFANEVFFPFFAGKLSRLLHIEKNSLIVNWPRFTPKKRKKFYRIAPVDLNCYA